MSAVTKSGDHRWLDFRAATNRTAADRERVWLRIAFPSAQKITTYNWATGNDSPVRAQPTREASQPESGKLLRVTSIGPPGAPGWGERRSIYFFGAAFPSSARTTSHAPPESMRTTHSAPSVHFVTCFFFPV